MMNKTWVNALSKILNSPRFRGWIGVYILRHGRYGYISPKVSFSKHCKARVDHKSGSQVFDQQLDGLMTPETSKLHSKTLGLDLSIFFQCQHRGSRWTPTHHRHTSYLKRSSGSALLTTSRKHGTSKASPKLFPAKFLVPSRKRLQKRWFTSQILPGQLTISLDHFPWLSANLPGGIPLRVRWITLKSHEITLNPMKSPEGMWKFPRFLAHNRVRDLRRRLSYS